mmetsp:Transcript_10063/g.16968  ORF Transcript_10063/g.16968 Transcript_10063/m.16968 type:complete len:93 (+) Transcript_10063:1055-1333(+)
MINGNEIDPKFDERCYIGIMKNLSGERSDQWVLGRKFLEKYYVLFDASELENEEGEEPLTLGIGLKNMFNAEGLFKETVFELKGLTLEDKSV